MRRSSSSPARAPADSRRRGVPVDHGLRPGSALPNAPALALSRHGDAAPAAALLGATSSVVLGAELASPSWDCWATTPWRSGTVVVVSLVLATVVLIGVARLGRAEHPDQPAVAFALERPGRPRIRCAQPGRWCNPPRPATMGPDMRHHRGRRHDHGREPLARAVRWRVGATTRGGIGAPPTSGWSPAARCPPGRRRPVGGARLLAPLARQRDRPRRGAPAGRAPGRRPARLPRGPPPGPVMPVDPPAAGRGRRGRPDDRGGDRRRGRMLWVEGDPRLRTLAAGMHFVEGARWAEDVAGTNAPGTALAVDHAVQIYGSEHFRRPVQPWSCSAAPVHDPVTGALLGAIDVTGGDHVASPHVLTLVRATVAAVEGELRWLHREQPARRHRPPRPPRRRSRGWRFSAATGPGCHRPRAARSLAAPLRAPAAAGRGRCRRRGRTAAELAAECHAADAAAVTVRAELSRLRRLLGDSCSPPPLPPARAADTDLDQLRRLLAARSGGLGTGALSRRGAPLSPHRASRSPATGSPRSCGRPCCAAAVPTSCSATAAPRGQDDAAVWQACWSGCRRQPRRATAAAHLRGSRLRGPPAPADARSRLGRYAPQREAPGGPRLGGQVIPLPDDRRPAPRRRAGGRRHRRPGARRLRDRHHRVRHHGPAARHRHRRRASTSPRPATSSRPTRSASSSAPRSSPRSAPGCRGAPARRPDGRLPGRELAHRDRSRLPHAPGRPVPGGLPHGAYFGVASLVAASLVGPHLRGRAVSSVMLGLSVAQSRRGAGRHLARAALRLAVGLLGGRRARPGSRCSPSSRWCRRRPAARTPRCAVSWARSAVPRCC